MINSGLCSIGELTNPTSPCPTRASLSLSLTSCFFSCRFSADRFIRVSTNRTEIGDRFMIIVEDIGSSIPKDRIPYLFHWFDNPEDARDDAEIDLSIIFRLALKIDGYLEYDPSYTEGTRMKLIF